MGMAVRGEELCPLCETVVDGRDPLDDYKTTCFAKGFQPGMDKSPQFWFTPRNHVRFHAFQGHPMTIPETLGATNQIIKCCRRELEISLLF